MICNKAFLSLMIWQPNANSPTINNIFSFHFSGRGRMNQLTQDFTFTSCQVSKNMKASKAQTRIKQKRPKPTTMVWTEIPEKVRLGSKISALNRKTHTNNASRQTRSNNRSTMMVEKAPEKVISFFFPTR